jgi:hypothetical protein
MPPSSSHFNEGVLPADAEPPSEPDYQCICLARNLLLMLVDKAARKDSPQHRIHSLLSTQQSSFSPNSISDLFLLLFGPDLLQLSERLASYGCMSQPAALTILERASRDVEAMLHSRLPGDDPGAAIRRAAEEARAHIPVELASVDSVPTESSPAQLKMPRRLDRLRQHVELLKGVW